MDMVGIVGSLREQARAIFNDLKLQSDVSAKVDTLKRLKEMVMAVDASSLLHEFAPLLMDLKDDDTVPVKSYLSQVVEEIGLRHLEHNVITILVPVLQALLSDHSPTVVRHAISASSNLFANIFLEVAKQGLYLGRVEKYLEESWHSITTLKEAMYGMAKEIQSKSDGLHLLTIKFIEMTIFLFTPDPNGAPQPPTQQNWDGHIFNISWLVGGHPILDAEQLGREAEGNLAHLLDQLQPQHFLKLSGPVSIVLVNSLASVAKRRPATYESILSALIQLGPICEGIKGPQRASVIHAVKNALLNLLKCTHSGELWREQLKLALKAMNAGDAAETAVRQTDRMLRNAEKERAFRESRLTKDERLQPLDHKRPLQENGCVSNDVENSGKRMRLMPNATKEGSADRKLSGSQVQGVNTESSNHNEVSPLQQMIDIIGALVAKGERATASIELLITSLPPDMLADVVIENMKNLPPTAPALPSGISGVQSSTIGSEMPTIASAPTSEPPSSVDHRRDPRRDPRRLDPRRTAVSVGVSQPPVNVSVKCEKQDADVPSPTSAVADEQYSSPAGLLKFEKVKVESIVTSSIPEQINSPVSDSEAKGSLEATGAFDGSILDAAIPDVDSLQPTPGPLDSSPETINKPSTPPIPPETEDHVQLLEPMDVEESVTDLSSGDGEAAMVGLTDLVELEESDMASRAPVQFIPSVNISDAQQYDIWKMIILRILESYKVTGPASNNHLSFNLVARLVSQTDGNEETMRILIRYILADYVNNKGHELSMHILYQLCAEKASHPDEMGSNTSASKSYDHFFIALAEGLRDTLPPTDKSLSKFFGEAPILPDIALKLLESLCIPAKEGPQPPNGDRITQGLSAVWVLILLRPPMRSKCLEIALKCAVHELDEVRTKAIRLVANKLYALPYTAQRIEDFATSLLYSAVGWDLSLKQEAEKVSGSDDTLSHDHTTEQVKKHEEISVEVTAEKSQPDGEEGKQMAMKTPISLQEAQRCTSLYFALCTKKIPLLRLIFTVYESAPKAVKQAAHRNMPVLVRTIGPSSPELLQLISDPPTGSKNLLLLVLHLLTESAPPSSELIATVKRVYESKLKDARLLTPILSSLSKEEVLPIFPHLVALPSEDFKAALDRILQGSVHTGPALTPAEVLIAIHGIDPERDHIPLPMVKEACAVCFQQRTVFTQQVLAKVLNQLVEQTPVPMLFMRTVILAVGSFRTLVSFVMEILSRLITKQIWKWPNLWIGFLKCADQTQPHSFHVLLQLPAQQLEKALIRHPNLRAPLTAHANKASVRSTLTRSTLSVLGLVQDNTASETTSRQNLPDVSSTNVIRMDTD